MKTSKTTTAKCYRQGDVMLMRVDSLPKHGLTKVPRSEGKIVVALGSSNGNPHYFSEPKSEMLQNESGDRYLDLVGEPIKGSFPVIERKRNWIVTEVPQRGKVAFAETDVTEKGKKISVDGRFSLLQHAEHTPHAILADTYNYVPQRGYNRGEIRRVQD